MKIFYDENMPFAHEFFHDFNGESPQLVPFNGRTLTADQTSQADVLLVRSITQVNEALLAQNKQLKFVGTATIGVDHIDQSYLQNRGVPFYSAPGCNAISVAEYVISALVILAERYQFSLLDKTVGIIGAGNTGTGLTKKLDALGIKYKLHDPIKQLAGDQRDFSSLAEVLACDVISLHVPKTTTGDYPTYHLLNQKRLAELKNEQILINACRGEVIDNQALLALKQQGLKTKLVLDVWENEPNILHPLISYTEIATAHIAGYSLEGKARGTEMLYQALCQQLNLPVKKQLVDFLPQPKIGEVKINYNFDEILLNQMVKMVYDVNRDDALFRQQISRFGFDHIRKTYPARREFSSVVISSANDAELTSLYQLGFNKH